MKEKVTPRILLLLLGILVALAIGVSAIFFPTPQTAVTTTPKTSGTLLQQVTSKFTHAVISTVRARP